MSPNATSRQLHVSLAENHRCDPVVRLRITSGLSVIRPESGPDLVADVAGAIALFVVWRNFI
jgi:hypothetical protein